MGRSDHCWIPCPQKGPTWHSKMPCGTSGAWLFFDIWVPTLRRFWWLCLQPLDAEQNDVKICQDISRSGLQIWNKCIFECSCSMMTPWASLQVYWCLDYLKSGLCMKDFLLYDCSVFSERVPNDLPQSYLHFCHRFCHYRVLSLVNRYTALVQNNWK